MNIFLINRPIWSKECFLTLICTYHSLQNNIVTGEHAGTNQWFGAATIDVFSPTFSICTGSGDLFPEESSQQPSTRRTGCLSQSPTSTPGPQTHSVSPARRVYPLLRPGIRPKQQFWEVMRRRETRTLTCFFLLSSGDWKHNKKAGRRWGTLR